MNQRLVCRHLALMLVAIGLWSPAALSQTAQVTNSGSQPTRSFARIVQLMQRKLDQSRLASQIPGAQVGFVYIDGETPEGKPRYVFGSVVSGVSNLESITQLKKSDRLLAGSIGKTFVSSLALMLVQDGKLNLDDKIEKWLGSEAWFKKLPNAKDITLRMLLNHSSGIDNHAELENFQKQALKSAGRNIKYEELIEWVLNKKPLFPAGTGYHYADTNYILAGMIIEKATGKSLYEQIEDRILKPFKLERTTPSNTLTIPEMATGYLENKPVIVGGKFTINPQWEWAGGGFASNAEDLARWASLLYGGAVLTQKSLDEMFNSTSSGEGSTYGLGAMVTRSKWGRSYGHDGEFPGYSSDMRYYAKYNIAIAVMANVDGTVGVDRFLSSACDNFAGVIIGATGGKQISQAEQLKFQAQAETWLGLIFGGKFDESWEQLSDRLQRRFPKDVWANTMKAFLNKAGKFNSRKLTAIVYSNPESKSIAIDFESSFSKLPTASETLTLELENGVWKVESYSLR